MSIVNRLLSPFSVCNGIVFEYSGDDITIMVSEYERPSNSTCPSTYYWARIWVTTSAYEPDNGYDVVVRVYKYGKPIWQVELIENITSRY